MAYSNSFVSFAQYLLASMKELLQRLCISADTGKRVLKILKSQCYHLEDGNQCPAYGSTLLCEHRCGIIIICNNVCKKLRARAHAARATSVGNGLNTFCVGP